MITDGLRYRADLGPTRTDGRTDSGRSTTAASAAHQSDRAERAGSGWPRVEASVVRAAGLEWPHSVFLGAIPSNQLDLADHLVDETSPVRQLMLAPPKLRAHGWSVYAGSNVRLEGGQTLCVASEGCSAIEVWKDGAIGYAFAPSFDSIGQMREEDVLRLNGLELTERLFSFMEFTNRVLDAVDQDPGTVVCVLTMRKLREGASRIVLGPYLPGMMGWQFEDDLRAAQQDEIVSRTPSRFPLNPETGAYSLLRDVYLAFGVTVNKLPYVVEAAQGRTLSRSGFMQYVTGPQRS